MAELARKQHGVVARRQLLALGVPARSITEKAKAEAWTALQAGVYLLPGGIPGFEQRTMAAVLRAGPSAVASHLTAAYLLGIVQGTPPVIDVLLPAQVRARGLDGVHVSRSRTLERRDASEVHGIPCTTAPRTVIDLAAVLEPPALRAVVIDAVQRRATTIRRVLVRLADLGPVRGSGELRRILWELDAERCDSVLEYRARRLIARAALPPPAPGPVAVRAGGRTLHVDIGWPQSHVGLEVDGRAWHSDRRAFDRDQRRHNALVLAGWRILRVGWDRIEGEPDGLIAELRGLLPNVDDRGDIPPRSSTVDA